MAKIVKTIDGFLFTLTKWQQFISNGLLVVMMTVISADVIGRNFFNKPLKGTFEITEMSSALLVFFALAMTHRYREHISIDFAARKLPQKAQHILESVIEIVIFVTVVFMANHVFANAVRVMERQTTTSDLGMPIYPFLFIATFALVVFALVALVSAFKFLLLAVNKA